MMEHYIVLAIVSTIFTGLLSACGFVLSGHRSDIKSLQTQLTSYQVATDKRIGHLEVGQGEIKTDIKYIRESLGKIEALLIKGQH